MTILHVSTPASWRGGEQQVAYLVNALHDKGIEQIVLTIERSALSKRLMEENIPVTTFISRGFMDINVARKISALCKDKTFDIIHCHDSHAHSAAVMAASLFGNKVPIIVSRRVDFPVSGNPLSKWKYNHPMVKRIICVSETIRTITAPAIGDKNKLAVVHSGIDLSKYQSSSPLHILHEELGLPATAKIVGNLSALADHKDYATFIRTAGIVSATDPNIHFVIAGTGPEEKKIKNLIRDLKLNDNIHLLGFRDDPVTVMQSLDLFLITSVTEGLGTIVLEAFAAGVPVVATRAGGIPEMVTDEVTGLLAAPRDVDALSKAVLRVLNNPILHHDLMTNALVKVQEFSYEVTAERTLEIYFSCS
ncbi:MAG TPA: glycosyltransferase family 4 protein [Saprospiraceae bacterium]